MLLENEEALQVACPALETSGLRNAIEDRQPCHTHSVAGALGDECRVTGLMAGPPPRERCLEFRLREPVLLTLGRPPQPAQSRQSRRIANAGATDGRGEVASARHTPTIAPGGDTAPCARPAEAT